MSRTKKTWTQAVRVPAETMNRFAEAVRQAEARMSRVGRALGEAFANIQTGGSYGIQFDHSDDATRYAEQVARLAQSTNMSVDQVMQSLAALRAAGVEPGVPAKPATMKKQPEPEQTIVVIAERNVRDFDVTE